jgi:hypothetical protein
MSASRIITDLGGPAKVGRLLGASTAVVSAWSRANRVPAKWHAALANVASDLGRPLSLEDVLSLGSPTKQAA